MKKPSFALLVLIGLVAGPVEAKTSPPAQSPASPSSDSRSSFSYLKIHPLSIFWIAGTTPLLGLPIATTGLVWNALVPSE